jgi:hypothetical protein
MRKAFLGIVASAMVLGLAACDDATSNSFGTVSVYLTDAPGEVTEAWVTITDIYLQGRPGDEDEPGGRFYLLQDGNETHDLLTLQNDEAQLVAGVPVPAGTYGQFRIVVSDACIVVDGKAYTSSPDYDECGGADGVLHMPSLRQTGIKVLMHGFQVTGGDQAILLDFDVSQSFGHQAGNSGRWVMQPVIHGAEVSMTGGIVVTLDAGEVELPEEMTLEDFGATVYPADPGDAKSDSFTCANDVCQVHFAFLIPDHGPFEVELSAPEGYEATVDPESPQVGLTLSSGQTVKIDWVLQSLEEDTN